MNLTIQLFRINKYVISFKKYFNITEAISLKNVRKFNYNKSNGGAYKIDKINKIFGKKDRLVYDIDLNVSDLLSMNNPIIYKITNFITNKFPDYEIKSINDYINGYAYKKTDEDKKQPLRIGKMLTKFSDEKDVDALLKSFKNDPLRSTKKYNKYKVVISRHPYDIAGMSTDRNWSSCMNLGYKGIHFSNSDAGVNKHYVQNDISEGSIIAYLISPTDVHENGKPAIHRPLSRILMKPHINENIRNDYAYSRGRTYGASNPKFSQFIDKWLIENINNDTVGKRYYMPSSLYPDGDITPNFTTFEMGSKIANRAFFDQLDSTDPKYYNNFEVVSEFEDGIQVLEFKISFKIPENIKLEDFRYNSSYPKYIQNILNQIDLEWNYSKVRVNGGVNIVQSFSESNTLVIEYRFTTNYHLSTDEKGNTIPEEEDQIADFWSGFIDDVDISDINYKESYDDIIKILSSINLESDAEEELKELKIKFHGIFDINSTKTSPDLKEQLKKYKLNYPQYQKYKKYILSLGQPTPEQMLRIAETEEYKDAMEYIRMFNVDYVRIKDKIQYLINFENYPLINAREKWYELVDDYFGRKWYGDIKPEQLRANIKLRADFKRDHPEEYDKLDELYDQQSRAFK